MSKFRHRNIGLILGGVLGATWIIWSFEMALLLALFLVIGWGIGYVGDNPKGLKKLLSKFSNLLGDVEE